MEVAKVPGGFSGYSLYSLVLLGGDPCYKNPPAFIDLHHLFYPHEPDSCSIIFLLCAAPELLRTPPCKRSIVVGYPNLPDDTGCMDWRIGSTILMTAKALWSQGSLIQYGSGAGSARVRSDPSV